MAASASPGGRIDSVPTTDLTWRYTFGIIKRLQARGDFEVLASRGRRVLRVHLKDLDAGLRDLHAIVQKVA